MKLRIKLVTGELLRCEGRVSHELDMIRVFTQQDVDKHTIFLAPRAQVIYVASEEVSTEPPKQ